MKLRRTSTIASITCLAVAISVGTLFGADRDQRGQLSERDYKFVKEAALGGQSEVELGDLAKQKGTDQSVRTFGERTATDHRKANDELKRIAEQKGAVIPAELSHGERSEMDALQKKTGPDFDKAYAARMVKDHKKDVKDFKDAADDLKDPELKAFAQKTLPTLEEHLRMAEDMERTVSGK